MEERLVSIIIPTFRRSREYLSRAVESVTGQSYKNIEIIVIDDSPDDFSGREDISRYMEALCKTDSRVKFYKNDSTLGGSLARNRGISLSHGDYITFLDDDDEYLSDKVLHQTEFMEKEGCDLSITDMVMYNTQGTVVEVRTHEHFDEYNNGRLLQYHLTYHITGTPTFMFRAESLKKIGGFEDVKMGQEFYLALKAVKSGLTVGYMPVCDVKIYKHNDGGISQGKNKIAGEKKLYEFKKQHFDVLDKKQRRFVGVRHYAVLAVAYAREKRLIPAMGCAIMAFLSSPAAFIREVIAFIKRIADKN